MPLNFGAITVPVRLQLGDGEPMELGDLPVTLAVPTDGYAVRLADETEVKRHLAELLTRTAHKLRDENRQADAP